MPLTVLDNPQVLRVLFYPRRELDLAPLPPDVSRVAFEVEPGLLIGGRLYPAGCDAPAILFFHGNGEIAADYDDLAPLYTSMDITLLVVDYRGYGTSGGVPTATGLLADAMAVFDRLDAAFESHGLAPARRYVMGRSLGSAAALEVAVRAGERLAGLIVESGFAGTFDLMQQLGLIVRGADEARDGFGNLAKIARVAVPTLIIHGDADRLIPPAHGRDLYRASAAAGKRLVLIPWGDHNDLMAVGEAEYFEAIRDLVWDKGAVSSGD